MLKNALHRWGCRFLPTFSKGDGDDGTPQKSDREGDCSEALEKNEGIASASHSLSFNDSMKIPITDLLQADRVRLSQGSRPVSRSGIDHFEERGAVLEF